MHVDGNLELELSSGERRLFEHVISSMPLTQLVRALPLAPDAVKAAATALHFRNTILVYLCIKSRDLFPDQWLYVHAPELKVGRITNYRNWVGELHHDLPQSILSLELWCDPGDDTWLQPDECHVEQAVQDLHKTGLIKEETITGSHVVRVPNCYPVYELGYKKHIEVLKDYLKPIPGLQVIGRAGSFKYTNQDHSLLMGMLAAENFALGLEHDLWSISSDDTYQENASIDATGLVPRAL